MWASFIPPEFRTPSRDSRTRPSWVAHRSLRHGFPFLPFLFFLYGGLSTLKGFPPQGSWLRTHLFWVVEFFLCFHDGRFTVAFRPESYGFNIPPDLKPTAMGWLLVTYFDPLVSTRPLWISHSPIRRLLCFPLRLSHALYPALISPCIIALNPFALLMRSNW